MSSRMPWRQLSALILVLGILAAASPVLAASCRGASHEASLTNGSVSPDSGPAGTSFRFKVTYSDNASCVPARVTVKVGGVGSYDMAAHGSSAVSYQRDVVLPVGAHTYSFEAESGSGPGYQLLTLTIVSPPQLTVTNPVPKATPRPTPAPTPPPTPKPPPPATPPPPPPSAPVVVAVATAAPATPIPSATPQPSPIPSTEPSPAASSATAGRGAAIGGARSGSLGLIPPAFAEPASALPWLAAWAVATAGGLAAFVLLVRRGSWGQIPTAPTGGAPPPVSPDGAPPPARRRKVQTGDESQLPRWLRPSVQAARYARPGQDGGLADD